MNRTWHVFGGTASTVVLHHNSPVTDGSSYNDAAAFITRYQGASSWTIGVAEQTAVGVRTNTGAIGSGIPSSSIANGTYLTKTSDASAPLSVILLAFHAVKNGV